MIYFEWLSHDNFLHVNSSYQKIAQTHTVYPKKAE